MPIQNPSFEVQGTLPGEAEGWTLDSSTALEIIAGFGDPATAYEDFERWYDLLNSFDNLESVRAVFGSITDAETFDQFEEFERGWNANLFFTEFQDVQLLVGVFGTSPNDTAFEAFERDWANVPYLLEFPAVSPPLTAGVFDGLQVEKFEANWKSNQTYWTDWSAVSASAALFDGGTQAVEDYENDWVRHLGDPLPTS